MTLFRMAIVTGSSAMTEPLLSTYGDEAFHLFRALHGILRDEFDDRRPVVSSVQLADLGS